MTRMRILAGLAAALAVSAASGTALAQSSDRTAVLAKAQAEFDRGDYAAALADLNPLLEREPNFVLGLFLRGKVYSGLGNQAEAVRAYDRVIALDPRESEAYYNRGTANADRGEYALALPDYDRYLTLNPGNADGLANRCQARAALNRELDKAKADCDDSLRRQPNDPITLASRGLVGLRKGDYAAAVADYGAAVALNPKNTIARYGLGLARLRSGQEEAGRADIASVNAVGPGVADRFAGWGLKP